ncbi:MAG TPA: CBS domain-containing protein [Phycisphaerae bacterium]
MAVVERGVTVVEAARIMQQRSVGAVLVMNGDTIQGIFTERDLLNRVVAAGRDVNKTRVSEVMTSSIATCRRSTPIEECQSCMAQLNLRHLPVVEDGKLLGMISLRDVLAWRMNACEHAVEQFSEYIYGRI